MDKPNETKIGMRFGSLTIVNTAERYTEPSGHTLEQVVVRCDCGSEYKKPWVYLQRGDSICCKSCAGKKRRSYQVGDVIDNLTILGVDKDKPLRPMYECQCVCGKIVKKRASQLADNETNSCGCQRTGLWKGSGQVSRTYFGRIKRNAAKRGIKFDITIEYMAELLEKQKNLCALTDLPIDFPQKTGTRHTASLDRIDSSRGYEVGNVQWVHVDVNLMKMDLTVDRLKELCYLVVKKGHIDAALQLPVSDVQG